MKQVILLLLFLLPAANSIGQTQFQRTFGGTSVDYASYITRTIEGGYAVVGTTASFGPGAGWAIYVVKLDASGSIIWNRTLGETGIYNYGYSIVQANDSGFVISGIKQVPSGYNDIYIIKLSSTGAHQWSKFVGGSSNDMGNSIIKTMDGGYAVGGSTWSFGTGGYDMYMLKLDGSGTLQWNKTIGGGGHDYGYSLIQTSDSGYAITGYTSSFGAGGEDMYITKLNSSGTLQWSRTMGGTNNEYGISIIQTTEGGYAITGYTNSSFGAGLYDMYTVKLNSSGVPQWTRTVGGSNNDYGNSIIQTTDGGYVIAGSTNSFGAGGDAYIVKLNSSGTVQWSKTAGGTGAEGLGCIISTSDGGYFAAGSTNTLGAGNYDMYFLKFDPNWNTCTSITSPSSISGTEDNTTAPTSTVTTPTPTVTTPATITATGGTLATQCFVQFPLPPSNLTATTVSSSRINLNWIDNSSNETGFKIERSTNAGTNWILKDSTVQNIITYADTGLTANTIYHYRIYAYFSAGNSPYSNTAFATTLMTGIHQLGNEIPREFSLSQNFPNPFNPVTKIKFTLPKSSITKITIYDISGREVTTLAAEQLNAGYYETEFDGNKFSSGVYYYKLSAGDYTETKKMVLIK